MAEETLYGTYGKLSIIFEGAENISESDYEYRILSVGSDTARIGDIVSENGETSGYVDLATTGDGSFLGVIAEPKNRPSDSWQPYDVIPDGTKVKILKPTGGRVKIMVNLAADVAGTTLKGGQALVLATVGEAKAYAYTDAAVATDTLLEYVGKLAYEKTLHASGADDTSVIGSMVY